MPHSAAACGTSATSGADHLGVERRDTAPRRARTQPCRGTLVVDSAVRHLREWITSPERRYPLTTTFDLVRTVVVGLSGARRGGRGRAGLVVARRGGGGAARRRAVRRAAAPPLGAAQLPGASATCATCWSSSARSCSSTSSSATSTAGPTTATPARSSTSGPRASRASKAFGTERNVNEVGYEYLVHATAPVPAAAGAAAGPDRRPALHAALRHGAAQRLGDELRRAVGQRPARAQRRRGGGRVRPRHRRGRPLRATTSTAATWCGSWAAATSAPARADGEFDPARFADKAAHDAVKCVSLKLSQGAKPGIGGVLPAAKVTRGDRRRARACRRAGTASARPRTRRSTRRASWCVRRAAARAGGRQAGGDQAVRRHAGSTCSRICKAMLDEGTGPDFVVVDGERGRHRRGPAGVLRPRRHAAHRGPDGRAQRAGRRGSAGPGEDRRGGQGRHRAPTSSSGSSRAPTTPTPPAR